MTTRLLLCVLMCTLATCIPRPPSTSTTLRLTAQRNDTGTWSAKFGDYQMIIEHKHFNKNHQHETQDGMWTLKVKHTSVYDVTDEAEDRQIVMDELQRYNNTPATTDSQFAEIDDLPSDIENEPTDQLPSNHENVQLSISNNENEQDNQFSNERHIDEFPRDNGNEQMETFSDNSNYADVDEHSSSNVNEQNNQFLTDNENKKVDEFSSNNENGENQFYNNNESEFEDKLTVNNVSEEIVPFSMTDEFGQTDQLSNINEAENGTNVEDQMTSEEREHYLAEEERKLIMDRYPRSRSLAHNVREFDLESKGYRFYREVGWVKLHTAHWQWDEARKFCEAEGGHLAIPDTLHKIKTFKHILKENVDIIERAVLKNQVFVGVYVPYNNRRFITVKGEPFTPESVSIWFPNEPNDADPGEDCVTLHLEGKLRDVPCFYNLPFLCQIH